MCIVDGNADCIINPISNAIYNVILPFFDWIIGTLYNIFLFIYNIGSLGVAISNLIIGLLGDIFATNPYAAVVLSLIITGISIVLFLRIYNIISGIEVFGFKLPKL